jgi:hypothetical protein
MLKLPGIQPTQSTVTETIHGLLIPTSPTDGTSTTTSTAESLRKVRRVASQRIIPALFEWRSMTDPSRQRHEEVITAGT